MVRKFFIIMSRDILSQLGSRELTHYHVALIPISDFNLRMSHYLHTGIRKIKVQS